MSSALGPGMEILCSGTPDAVKKVFLFTIYFYCKINFWKQVKVSYDKEEPISFPDGFYKPTNQIRGAHNKAEQSSSIKQKKKRNCVRGMAPSVVSVLVITSSKRSMLYRQTLVILPAWCVVGFFFLSQDSQQSVTVVLFQDQHTLISSGAVDG